MSRSSSVRALTAMVAPRRTIFGVALALALGCNAKVATVLGNDGSGSGSGSDGGAGLIDEDRPLVPATKVDLLLVVDDSKAMGDKSERLASSIGTLLRGIARVGDVHVGVISTSLGGLGGDVCESDRPETNGRAHLRTTGPGGAPVPGAETGVIRFAGGDVEALVSSTEALVRGAGERGCDLEAQLESMYRFLIQPDPWESVTVDSNLQADLATGTDQTVLAQRKAFLRPDSALVVVLLTDEDDSSADPLSVNGQGWGFMARSFPGSKVVRAAQNGGTTAPRATSVCASDPRSADCTSCGFQWTCDHQKPECQKLRADPNCRESPVLGSSGAGFDGYFAPADEELNVRFHRMKERYGVDPQYPIARYIDGLSKSVVPHRSAEHSTTATSPWGPREIGAYSGKATCTNPIFAAQLPSAIGDELCNLPRGPRSRELVLFAVLGGLPSALATATPEWIRILGVDPDNFDLRNIDPHMIQSTEPRAGLPTAPGSDPVHGREYATFGGDLQYACRFALPAPRTCSTTPSEYCECQPDSPNNPPVCGEPGVQTHGKAYPTIRPLRVVRALGERGVVGSVCADDYNATMTLIDQRLAGRVVR